MQPILKAMNWERAAESRQNTPVQRTLFPELTEEEARVVKILSRDDLHINTLVVEANIPVNRMSALLFELEMKGVVKALVGGVYHLLA